MEIYIYFSFWKKESFIHFLNKEREDHREEGRLRGTGEDKERGVKKRREKGSGKLFYLFIYYYYCCYYYNYYFVVSRPRINSYEVS